MKTAVLFHVSYEKLGTIEDWMLRKGHMVTEFHLYNNPGLPQVSDFDLLIIMGGSMSIRDEVSYPWLKAEKELIAGWIKKGKGVIGICLGAQLIASVLGSKVFAGKNREIGWFPIDLNQDNRIRSLFPGLPEKVTVFHWHGETFNLPPDCVSLASSSVTPCQGFIYGNHVLALQFHPEVKPENISLMINYAGDELIAGPFIQDAPALSAGLKHLPWSTDLMEIFLTGFENLIGKESPDGSH